MDKPTAEKDWYNYWLRHKLFAADPNSAKKPYSILMPPPNVNGELHLGHAMQQSIMDALARFKRMQGFDVLLLPGVDHAGIIFESTFNKELAKKGLSKQKLGHEEWLKQAWQFKEEVYHSFHQTWDFLGISADWDKEVFTLDPPVQKAVFEEFKSFWEQDLLYKGAYIVQWCPKDGTAIEDVEMEYEQKKEKLYFVKYQISDQPTEFITVATARPETIFADVAIAVYPNHPQYKKYLGQKAINPLTGNEIPIIEDKRVQEDFGTGALKITPGHDPLDFAIGQDNNLPIMHAVDKTGRMTELTEDLSGLKIEEARQLTIQKLGPAVEKVEDYTHAVPVCERCKTVIEPLISEEWFVKMQPIAQKALSKLSQINFLPKNYQKILATWMKEIHDWSISRNLWWGHRIPVWYCQTCNPTHQVGKDKDMVVALSTPEQTCQTCGQTVWVQEEAVLDTWFSSGLWPLATLGWPEKTQQLSKYFPWDFELTAPEIKYLWIARQIMIAIWFTEQIPFKNMFFHGTLRDIHGQKFSKSLGNGISPYNLVQKWDVDPTRMALFSYSAPGRDARTSQQLMDERCKNYRNFATKLKNIYRFIYELKPAEALFESDFSHDEDIEIIQHLNGLIDQVTNHLENYQLHLATESLYDFIWHKLADSYLELSKKRRTDAQPCLEYIFTTCLKLLHPFMPFTSEDLWHQVYPQAKSIMQEDWPESLKQENLPFTHKI